MTSEPRNYELAYLLVPSITEGEVLSYSGKISAAIEEEKGVVKRAEEPRKRMLSYPVNKQKNGYFGWTVFSMLPGTVRDLQKKLKTKEFFLRYLITEEEVEKHPSLIRPFPSRRPAVSKPKIIRKPDEIKPEEKLDLEALDKKLEEILGK